MKVSFDMPRLERSLKRFAGEFGETNAQAVVRWSIQTCRELAKETIPFGTKSAKNRKAQKFAITRDLGRVVFVDNRRAKSKADRASGRSLANVAEVSDWLDKNRSGYKNRTKKLPPEKRKTCSKTVFNGVVRMKMKQVGIAKGGWLGAGMDIARAQTGQDRITIGKNYLGYAQKHKSFGDSKRPKSGFSPFATVTNKAGFVAKNYVVPRKAYDKALGFGLKATIKWYARAVRALDKKS